MLFGSFLFFSFCIAELESFISVDRYWDSLTILPLGHSCKQNKHAFTPAGGEVRPEQLCRGAELGVPAVLAGPQTAAQEQTGDRGANPSAPGNWRANITAALDVSHCAAQGCLGGGGEAAGKQRGRAGQGDGGAPRQSHTGHPPHGFHQVCCAGHARTGRKDL